MEIGRNVDDGDEGTNGSNQKIYSKIATVSAAAASEGAGNGSAEGVQWGPRAASVPWVSVFHFGIEANAESTANLSNCAHN